MTPHLPLNVAGATDRGLVRARNEDRFEVVEALGVACVADGMGGHPGGDVAAEIAVGVLCDELSRRLDGDAHTHTTPEGRERAMRESVDRAHGTIRRRARDEPALAGMGTTIVALVLGPDGRGYTIAHLGDSRAYRFRDGGLERLTDDHTWLERDRKLGLAPTSDPRRAHMLTRCLGFEESARPDIRHGNARPGDVFVLCSDGLHGELTDPEIAEILGRERKLRPGPAPPREAADALVHAARERGGPDNVTVVLLAVR